MTYETKLFVQKRLDIFGVRNALPGDFREVIMTLEQQRFPWIQRSAQLRNYKKAPEVLASWDANPARFTKIMISLD